MGLFDLFSDDTQQAASAGAVADTKDWSNKAHGYINKGLRHGVNPLKELNPQYQGLINNRTKADSLYSDSLGVNGPEGNQRAVNAFQCGPGYDWAMQQGNESILRNNAAVGGLASGKTLEDLTTYGQGMANQEYGNWQGMLQQYNPLDPLNAKASNLQNLAGLYENAGVNKATIAQNAGKAITDANYASAMSPLTSGANQFSALMGIANLGLKASGVGGFAPK